jgi:hypothetical protein
MKGNISIRTIVEVRDKNERRKEIKKEKEVFRIHK